MSLLRWVWPACLAIVGLYLLIGDSRWNVLDGVSLLMHEAGHLLFSFLGAFVQILGGTLLQLVMPISFLIYFWRQRQIAGAQFGLFWLGQNLINVGVYVADARSQALPLIGDGLHDWAYLLGRIGLLQQDQVIASMIYVLAAVAFGGMFLVPFWIGEDHG